MEISNEKRQIIEEILITEDGWVLKAIKKLLDIDDADVAVSEEHQKILDERLAYHEANPNDVISWESIKEELKLRNVRG